MNYLKVIGAGILALGISLPVWADLTKEEIVAKIEAGLSQAQKVQHHDQRVAAVDALLRAGVAPEKCVTIVQSALAHDVPIAEVVKLAREVEARAQGDRAKAEQYARQSFAAAEKRHEAADRMQKDIVSPTQGEHGPGGSGMGMGSGDFSGGSGMGQGGR